MVVSIYFSASLDSDGIHQSWNKLQPNPEKDPTWEVGDGRKQEQGFSDFLSAPG